MTKQPKIEWFLNSQEETAKVTSRVSYGTIDADTESNVMTFYIWNNRAGVDDVSKAEDVQITTRDLAGGLGDMTGSIVEAVRDNWMRVRNDSMNESNFTAIGKGGVGTENPSGYKQLGTTGTTRNVKADTATPWTATATLSLGDIIAPTIPNGFVYEVTVAGTTGATEPTWLTTEGLLNEDDTVQFTAVQIEKTPALGEILGMANNTLEDGSNASDAGGNFVQISTKVEVPMSASSGINTGVKRVN